LPRSARLGQGPKRFGPISAKLGHVPILAAAPPSPSLLSPAHRVDRSGGALGPAFMPGARAREGVISSPHPPCGPHPPCVPHPPFAAGRRPLRGKARKRA
jgi:hypothetical protein